MTDLMLDNLARRVMLDAARQEYGGLINELPEHDFSQRFEQKMQKLVRRANHPIRYRAMQVVACLLLVILLSGCAVLAVSSEAREALYGWVKEVYETSYIYRFFGSDEEVTTGEIITYRPAYFPSEYHMTEEFARDGIYSASYTNESNNLAVFSCLPNIGSTIIRVDTDGTETYKQVLVNGNRAEMYLDPNEGESSVLIWMDENEEHIFRLAASVSETELIKIAESVCAVP